MNNLKTIELLKATKETMEKHSENSLGKYSLQTADISDHMSTIFQVGYALETLTNGNSAASQTDKRKIFWRFQGIVNRKSVSQRWPSKLAASGYNKWRKASRKDSVQASLSAERQLKVGQKLQPSVISDSVYVLGQSSFNEKRINEKMARERGSFKDYCEQSTIHGLKYIGDSSLPKIERIFWIMSVLLALSGAAFFIWHLYSKFSSSPIIISRAPASVAIDQFPFPALTLCNMNNAKKSLAQQIIRGEDQVGKFFLDDVCNEDANASSLPQKQSNEKDEKVLISDFLLKASQSCTEMIYYCEWNGSNKSCADLFNDVYTDEGICCNFNSVKQVFWNERRWDGINKTYASKQFINWTPEYVFEKHDAAWAIPWRGRASGASHGLTLALDVNVDEYYCSSTASVGFKMLLHSPVETPQMREYGLTLSPGKETRVIITPHITDASNSIQKISPKVRQCYFLHEKKLRYYRTYTQRNCQLECEANSTLKICHCMQYYMPIEDGMKVCDQTNDQCVDRIKKIMSNSFEDDEERYNDTLILPKCECYPGCYEIDYSTEISQSMLVATFEVGQKFFRKDPIYFEKNVAIVHIFYVDSSYLKYTKNELYGFAELLSNTGGLLGLFMGFSLLSVTEIIYYILLRVWRITYARKKRKNIKKRDAIYPFAQ